MCKTEVNTPSLVSHSENTSSFKMTIDYKRKNNVKLLEKM